MPRQAFHELPPFATTGIGSLPQTRPEEALAALRATELDVPYWPQLPRRSFLETMVPQAARSMPFLQVDDARRKVTAALPDERPARLAETWEWILGGDRARFALSPVEAATWEPFLAENGSRAWVKGQLTGPVTLGLGAVDEQERPIFFDADLREVLVQATAAAARWQAEALGAERRLAVVSADEPTLAVLGTAGYLGVRREDAVAALAAVLEAIRDAGGIGAVHSCGAAEWELVLEAGADVLFADAFSYGASLVAAAGTLRTFLERGGRIGWGLVPTDDAHRDATVEQMLARHAETERELVHAGIDRERLRAASLLTPACGCGSLEPSAAVDVFRKLRTLRDRLRSSGGAG